MSFSVYLTLLRRRGIKPLIGVGMLAKFPHALIGVPLTLHVVQTLGRSYFEAGILTMAFTVGAFFGGPWRGRSVDRSGIRKALIPSVSVEAVVWTVGPFLPYWAFVGCAVIGGLFMTPVFSIVRQSLAALVPAEHQKTGYALDAVTNEMVFMFGPMIGTILATTLSTRIALFAIGATIALGGLAFMIFNPPTTSAQARARGWSASVEEEAATSDADASSGALAAGARRRGVWSLALVAVLIATGAASFLLTGTDLAIVATLREWGKVPMTGVVMLFWSAGSLIGGLVYGAVKRSWHPLWLVFAMAAVTVPLGFVTSIPAVSVGLFVAGMLCAPALAAITSAIMAIVPENRRGEVIGWNGSASTVGSTLGSPAVGAVIDRFGGPAGFLGGAAVGVLLSLVGLVMYRRNPAHKDAEQEVAGDATAAEIEFR